MQRLKWCGGFVVTLASALLLASCSGFFPASDSITSLSLSPTSGWITPTNTQQFTATAIFGNNTSGDVTDKVTWLSSNTNVATIDNSGLVTAVALGTSTITAKSTNSSATATAPLTVSNKTIMSITVNPNPATMSVSGTNGVTQQQFTASATFSDGSVGNVTTSAGWTSSASSVVSINSSGVAVAVSTGSATISASLGGTAGTANVTVNQ
ncbi:MAG TPA: Ig-like domain-containing protein [Terriglobales bacterium]|nr:Ig-like domain-containing protein [Terriglobales bacterium]